MRIFLAKSITNNYCRNMEEQYRKLKTHTITSIISESSEDSNSRTKKCTFQINKHYKLNYFLYGKYVQFMYMYSFLTIKKIKVKKI